MDVKDLVYSYCSLQPKQGTPKLEERRNSIIFCHQFINNVKQKSNFNEVTVRMCLYSRSSFFIVSIWEIFLLFYQTKSVIYFTFCFNHQVLKTANLGESSHNLNNSMQLINLRLCSSKFLHISFVMCILYFWNDSF